MVGHIGHGPGGTGAGGLQFLGQGFQIGFAARDQEDTGPGPRRAACRRETDARGGTGDDNGLLVQGLERRFGHETAGSVCSDRGAAADFYPAGSCSSTQVLSFATGAPI